MRRLATILGILLIITSILAATGCGTQATGLDPATNDRSPEEVLAAAFAGSDQLTAATGGFDITITVDADKSQIPEYDMQFAQALVDNGMTLSGTFGYANAPAAADLSISGQLMGQPLDVGVRVLGETFWLRYVDGWYEFPAEMMDAYSGYSQQVDPEEVERLLGDLGLDPVTWFKDLTVVGEEMLGEAGTIHVTGSPDVMKMARDVVELMRSEELLALVDPSGSLASMLQTSGFPPGDAEMEEARVAIESVFQEVTVDLWVGKNDSMVRKMALTGHIAPPPGEDADGFLGMDFSAQMWLENINQPFEPEPPASPLPFTELESAVMQTPGIFQMLMGGFDPSAFGDGDLDRY